MRQWSLPGESTTPHFLAFTQIREALAAPAYYEELSPLGLTLANTLPIIRPFLSRYTKIHCVPSCLLFGIIFLLHFHIKYVS